MPGKKKRVSEHVNRAIFLLVNIDFPKEKFLNCLNILQFSNVKSSYCECINLGPWAELKSKHKDNLGRGDQGEEADHL